LTPLAARKRILLVDDEETLRLLLRMVLERSGRYEVVGEAADGHEALRLAAIEQPEIVLLDLSMPRMDGLEALPQLRHLLPEARLVVLSAFTAEGAAPAALEAGADAYLMKGLAPSELLDALDTIVQQAPAPAPAPDGGDGEVVAADPPGRVARPQPIALPTAEAVARLAHDVRTPLSLAVVSVEVLASVLSEDVGDEVRELIGSATTALERVELTLSAAVEHARTGQAGLSLSEVSLAPLVRAVIDGASYPAHRVAVSAESHIRTFADAGALQRVLTNLVENALRYSAGPVELELRRRSDAVVIEVRDEGPGLGDDPDALFEPFVRGGSAEGTEGTGLGLATAADLVHRMGGELIAQDRAGGGACFTVTLPDA
jgi:signal transduction histidine kinase